MGTWWSHHTSPRRWHHYTRSGSGRAWAHRTIHRSSLRRRSGRHAWRWPRRSHRWRRVLRRRFTRIGRVDVVKHGIKSFNAGHLDIRLHSQLNGGTQECLNFHGAPRLEVLVHGAGRFDCSHLVNSGLTEISRELAAMGSGKIKQLVNYA